jgi:hypothetical protein
LSRIIGSNSTPTHHKLNTQVKTKNLGAKQYNKVKNKYSCAKLYYKVKTEYVPRCKTKIQVKTTYLGAKLKSRLKLHTQVQN